MKFLKLTVFFVAIAFVLIFVLSKGTVEISFVETGKIVYSFLQGKSSQNVVEDVIYYLRLPRFILSLLIGAGLGITGSVMQAVMRNPLADPYLLGISSGAGLGAVLSIVLGWTSIGGFDSVGFFAFVGAITVTLVIVLISFLFGNVNTTTILLAGMALNSICAACISLLISVFADAERIQNVTFWLMGSLQNANWMDILFLAFFVVSISAYFILNSRVLNLMLLGDSVATTLGYELSHHRIKYIVLCAVVVGLIVYNGGIIGFIGLLVPHTIRLLFSGNYKYVLSGSCCLGAIFVAIADVLSRILVDGSEIPIGIVVSVLGAPIFVYLLVSRNYGLSKNA